MPDRNEVIRKICWTEIGDLNALASVDPNVLKLTTEQLAQPLTNYLILCQVVDQRGLWEKCGNYFLKEDPDLETEEAGLLDQFEEARSQVRVALKDIPLEAQASLLEKYIPSLEREINRQYPQYRYLVYDTKKTVEARREQEKIETRHSKVDRTVFWVILAILLPLLTFLEFKNGWFFGLDSYSSKLAASAGWGRVWLIVQVPLAIIIFGGFASLIASLVSSWFRKAAGVVELAKPLTINPRSAEQNWVWLCQRCQHLEPFLGEDQLDCPNCSYGMTKVMGSWGN